MSVNLSDKQRAFYEHVLGNTQGYLCIATRDSATGHFHEKFFEYPNEVHDASIYCTKMSVGKDVYFCSQTLRTRKRNAVAVSECASIWADLDECPPESMLVEPTLVVQTSLGRSQAYWRLTNPIAPEDAQRIAKKIAYYHADEGADKTGWDLSQLTRPPLTNNYKYGNTYSTRILVANTENRIDPTSFDVYPDVEETTPIAPSDMPTEDSLGNPESILEFHSAKINQLAFEYFRMTPVEDVSWSERLWQLELFLFEAGATPNEVFAVARDAACNKYARDNRPESDLWKEVKRAENTVESRTTTAIDIPKTSTSSGTKQLITDEERKQIAADPSFIENYVKWATSAVDAAPQYHPASGFIILSSLLASQIKIPTSFGTIIPNLWFMILADTTLTRKTTAMDMGIDLLYEVEEDPLLATDGSIEGILDGVSRRSGRSSLFLRDEITGLIEAFSKKDYYAGMMETFTKLYDGKTQKRILRKEVIELRNPVFIMYAGGIYDRIVELLQFSHVTSGFLPRFVFITAESDITRVKPVGPPTDNLNYERNELIQQLYNIKEHYLKKKNAGVNEGRINLVKDWNVELTQDAWNRYNHLEQLILHSALEFDRSELMVPVMSRLATTGLKVAALLAASKRLEDKILVEEQDIAHSFAYIENWREHSIDIVSQIGQTVQEKQLRQIVDMVNKQPGIMRGVIMQRNALSARDADLILATLEQRGLISRDRKDRGEKLYPASI